jgi:hypothetical protein
MLLTKKVKVEFKVKETKTVLMFMDSGVVYLVISGK